MRVTNELITWTEKLSCGVKVIDDQHKQLINMVNEMFNHITGNEMQEHNYFNRVIYEAVDYVKIHFATEEKLMIATKFEGYAEHKKEHENFIRVVLDVVRDHEAGKRLIFSGFTKFLKNWILSHVAFMDKQYFDYFLKIATRKANGKLSINSNDVKNRSTGR
jgi:hemerythrin